MQSVCVMKPPFFLLFCFLLIPLFTEAQKKTIEELKVIQGSWYVQDELFKNPDEHSFEFIMQRGDTLYLLHKVSLVRLVTAASVTPYGIVGREKCRVAANYYIEMYDASMKCLKSSLIAESEEYSKFDLSACIELNGELWCFFREHNERLTAFAEKIDINTLALTGERKKLFELERPWNLKDYYELGNQPFYFTFFESDSSKMVLSFAVVRERKKEKKSYLSFEIYDEHLQPVWKGKQELDYKFNDFLVEDLFLDQYGAVHLLVKRRVYKKADWRLCTKSNKKNIFWDLWSFFPDGRVVKTELDGDDDTRVFYELSLIDDFENGILLCTSVYWDTTKKRSRTTHGFRIGRYDIKSGKFRNLQDVTWTKEMQESLTNEVPEEKRNAKQLSQRINLHKMSGNYTLHPVRFFLREDGGFLVEVIAYFDPSAYYSIYHNTYIGPFLFSFSPDNELEWMRLMAFLSYDGYALPFLGALSSKDAKVFTYEDKIYFILTYIRNTNENNTYIPNVYEEFWVFYVSSAGERSPLLKLKLPSAAEKNERPWPLQAYFRLPDNGDLIFWTAKKMERKFRLYRISFDELAKHDRL